MRILGSRSEPTASENPAQRAKTEKPRVMPYIPNSGMRPTHLMFSWDSSNRDKPGPPVKKTLNVPCEYPLRAYIKSKRWLSSLKAKLRSQGTSD